jgi:hypothetical protein
MKLIGLLLTVSLLFGGCEKKSPTLFEELKPDQTGVSFNNTITDNDTFNIVTYEYIYNGGGVAIADFNNDGKQDLFFTGNQVDNKLYLNEGNWKFKDITTKAGVEGKGRWKSSVAITDLNYDGLLDIYITCMTYKPGARRANLLYINQGLDKEGTPTFKELAAGYGVADTTYSTTSAFLDYDNDGDQDLYLAVNHQEEREIPSSFHTKSKDGSSPNRDRLYRNDWDPKLKHPIFTEVSLQAGILGEGYGLGVNITDINRDGWKDIYVTNDYLTNDHLYINNHDGTFTDKADSYFKHTSYSAMGNDVVDFNNDGLVDFVAVDMMPEDNYRRKTMLSANNYNIFQKNEEFNYQHQYVRNTFQINQGNAPGTNQPVFSEISMLAGISSTDWSWTPLSADFDLDGYRDLIVTNGFPKDVTDLDFVEYNASSGYYASPEHLRDQITSVKLKNYAYRNRGDLTFENVGPQWGITHTSFSNGAAYGDLDNDGDLDYVVNNINDPASIFRNNALENAAKKELKDRPNWISIELKGDSLNPMGLGAWINLEHDNGQKQVWEHTIYRGYLSSVQPLAYFGLGKQSKIKTINISWPNGTVQTLHDVKANQVLKVNYQDAKTVPATPTQALTPWFSEESKALGINFLHQETDFIDFNVQPLLPHKLSQFGPGLAVADVNGDQLDDFFVTGGHFQKGRFFIQQKNGTFKEADLIDGPADKEKKGEDLGALFFDVDQDGDPDLYLVRGGAEFRAENPVYQDVLYLNEGGKFKASVGVLPAFTKSGSCVKAADYDRDGDLDLFIGGRNKPAQYPLPVSSYLLRNDSKPGKPLFTIANAEVAPMLKDLGLTCDALWTDYDQDGWVDLLLAGEWMPLMVLKNNHGKLENKTADSGLDKYKGWWNSLTSGDFDGDGDMDYVAGNLGLNTIYKASDNQPISMYVADFDGNKGIDAIPSVFFPNLKGVPEEFPYNSRLDLDKQVIMSKRVYLLHADFGKVNMKEYLSNFKDIKPLHLTANHLQSSLIRNLGNGKFAVEPLPMPAQFAPLFGTSVGDFNHDGKLDLIGVGNDYGVEVTMGHMDAQNGFLFLGQGNGKFSPETLTKSGFYAPGDAKSLVQLNGPNNKPLYLVGQNRGPLLAFRPNGVIGTSLALLQNDVQAEIKLATGKTLHVELYHGNGFLSQSARRLNVPENAVEVKITDFQGKSRVVKAKE